MKAFHGTNKEFEDFNCQGLGSHFGNEQQCLRAPGGNSLIYEVELDIKHPLEIGDMYSWDCYDLTILLEERLNLDLNDLKMKIVYAQGDPEKELGFLKEIKVIIETNGFDGIKYSNIMEGPGESYIAFHPSQVKIIAKRSRANHVSMYPCIKPSWEPSLNDVADSLDKTIPSPYDEQDPSF